MDRQWCSSLDGQKRLLRKHLNGTWPEGCFAYQIVGAVGREGEKREIREAPYAQHPSLQIARINQAAREPLFYSSYRLLYSGVLSTAKRFHGGDKIHVNRKSNRRKVARNVPKCVRGPPGSLVFLGIRFRSNRFRSVYRTVLENLREFFMDNKPSIHCMNTPNIRFIKVCRKSI